MSLLTKAHCIIPEKFHISDQFCELPKLSPRHLIQNLIREVNKTDQVENNSNSYHEVMTLSKWKLKTDWQHKNHRYCQQLEHINKLG